MLEKTFELEKQHFERFLVVKCIAKSFQNIEMSYFLFEAFRGFQAYFTPFKAENNMVENYLPVGQMATGHLKKPTLVKGKIDPSTDLVPKGWGVLFDP